MILNNGEGARLLMEEISSTINEAKEYNELRSGHYA